MVPYCAMVDWGTTSFRLWLVDGAGAVLAERRSDEGMAHCAGGDFNAVLESHLQAVGAPADLPVIICGMAGSRQGWTEARYLDVPAPLDDIITNAVRVGGLSRDVRIVPGIAQRDPDAPDVMRGEETQILGALGAVQDDGLICLPGTHSKWVRVSGGKVRRFRTFMTGELYAVISRETILTHALPAGDTDFDETAFDEAMDHALAKPTDLTASLFAIRAGHLLGFSNAADRYAALSGLLIGTEMAAARVAYPDALPLMLVASGTLAKRYRRALGLAGWQAEVINSEEAVLNGLFTVASALWPDVIGRKRG